MRTQKLFVAWALAGMALVATSFLPPATAFAATRAGSSDSDGAWTVPHWRTTVTDPTNQVAYPLTMVGSDPRLRQSTKVATTIIPLKFIFVAGGQDVSALNIPPIGYFPTPQAVAMNGRKDVADTIASPIFTPTNFPISGDTGVQFGDAFARAQFGKVGTDYHIILGRPRVADTVSIRVPASKGVAVFNPVGVLTGRVDSMWFRQRLARLIDEMELKPTILPIFLTNNVVLYQDANYLHCCTLGGHGAGSPTSSRPVSLGDDHPVRTFVYAAYISPNTFPRFPAPYAGLSDIHSLSHEIAEWIDNPFGTNMVQPYRIPTAPPGACGAQLETGDAVVGVWFPLPGNPNAAAGNVWHPQDEVFLNWFARDGERHGLAPADGRYTFMGPMTTAIGGPFAAFAHSAQAC